MGCLGKLCFGITAVIGVVAIILGVALGWGIGPYVVKTMVHETLDLTDENSDGYENFIVPPVAPRMVFTFFEVENYKELIDGTAVDGKPSLKEKGPYAFKEMREKKELNWTSNKEFLNFGQYKYYVFSPEDSCDGCTENDKVRILNMPAASFIAKAAREFATVAGGVFPHLNDLFNKENEFADNGDELFREFVVADFLFRGVKDGIVDFLMNEDYAWSPLVSPRLPDAFRENGFALFNGKVNTSEKECYQVSSSEVGWDKHTVINMWGMDIDNLVPDLSSARAYSSQGKPIGTGWWPYSDENGNTKENSTCNALKGTDGAQFPPDVKKSDTLWVFNTLPCRSLYFNYVDTEKIEGIRTLQFGVPADGANVNKTSNVCTCEPLSKEVKKLVDGKINDTCVRRSDDPETLDITNCDTSDWECFDGIMDITNCQGAPFYLSFPHFYLADGQRMMFSGLEPNEEKHKTYLNVEPNTGMTLRIHNRIQLNTVLYNLDTLAENMPSYWNPTTQGIDVLEKLNYFSTFPFLWLDLTASIDKDQEQVDKLKNQLVTPLLLLDVFTWLCIGAGIAVTLIGGFLFMCKK